MPPKIRAVYLKELRDALRDRRTLLAAVVVPLVLYPVMLLGVAEVSLLARAKIDKEVWKVAVFPGTKLVAENIFNIAAKAPEEIEDVVDTTEAPATPTQVARSAQESMEELQRAEPRLEFQELDAEAAAKALDAGAIQAIVELPGDFEREIDGQGDAAVKIKFDKAEYRSTDACRRLKRMFAAYRQSVIDARMDNNELDAGFLHPFVVETQDVAAKEKLGGSIVGSFLPLLFIIMILSGAIYPAIDMTAGEKERSTLETLISAPISTLEIMAGKFLAVATLALANSLLNVSSFGITFSLLPAPELAHFQFPWSVLPLTLLLLLPLTLFFAALLLAVCSFAANHKEAQIYCLPIYLVPVLGMLIVMMPGIELEGPLLLTPVLNTALLIKELFLGHGTAQQIAFVFVSTSLYAAGMVALAARIFAREEVLFSAQGSLKLLLSRRFSRPTAFPRAGDALLLAALLFPLNFYLQLGLSKGLLDAKGDIQAGPLALLVALSEYGLLFGVPFLAAWYLRVDFRQTFLWRRPSWRQVLGALCIGSGIWLIAMQLTSWQSYFWEYTPGDMEKFGRTITEAAQSPAGLAAVIFFVALTPAICEEHLFRGFLQQGVSGKSKWSAVLLSGAIFGLYHFPLFRQPVVMLLGVVLAYVAYETRSIWPSVIIHCCNNALAVVGPVLFGMASEKPEMGRLPGVPVGHLLWAVAMFAIGLHLSQRRASHEPPVLIEVVTPPKTTVID